MEKSKYLVEVLLQEGGYLTINKHMIRTIGLEEAALIQHLLSLSSNEKWGEEFFQQQDRIAEHFGWSKYKAGEVTKSLIKLNILSVTKRGVPAKNYFRINHENIVDLFSSQFIETQQTSDLVEKQPLEQIDPVSRKSINLCLETQQTSDSKVKELVTPKSSDIKRTIKEIKSKDIKVKDINAMDVYNVGTIDLYKNSKVISDYEFSEERVNAIFDDLDSFMSAK